MNSELLNKMINRLKNKQSVLIDCKNIYYNKNKENIYEIEYMYRIYLDKNEYILLKNKDFTTMLIFTCDKEFIEWVNNHDNIDISDTYITLYNEYFHNNNNKFIKLKEFIDDT